MGIAAAFVLLICSSIIVDNAQILYGGTLILGILFIGLLVLCANHERRQRQDRHTASGRDDAKEKRDANSFRLSAAFLLPISVLFFILFSFPEIHLKTDASKTDSLFTDVAKTVSEPTSTLINAEHQKAIGEIALRIAHDDDWFHYKFVLIGGLFAGLGVLLFKEQANSKRTSVWRVQMLLRTPIVSSIFAIVFIIAILVDMHVRASYIVVHQLAQWISNDVEPILNCDKSFFSSYCEGSSFMPWEKFVRVPGGMHADFFYNMFQTPHIHFSTWMMYILYMSTLYWMISRGDPAAIKNDSYIILFIFVIAHSALGLFAFIGHSVPAMFDEKILIPPLGKRELQLWISGEKAGFIFLIFWYIMVSLAALRLYTLFPPVDDHGQPEVLTVARFAAISIIVLVFFILAISQHIYIKDPRKERKSLGHFVVKVKTPNDINGIMKKKVAIIIEMADKDLRWVNEHDVADDLQSFLIQNTYDLKDDERNPICMTRGQPTDDAVYRRCRDLEDDSAPAVKRTAREGEPNGRNDREGRDGAGGLVGHWFPGGKGIIDEIKWILYSIFWPNYNDVSAPTWLDLDLLRLKHDEMRNKHLVLIGSAAKRVKCIVGQIVSAGHQKKAEKCDGKSREEDINVYFEELGYDKEELYKLPDFVANLKGPENSAAKQFKITIIVKTPESYVRYLKGKEAQVMGAMQSFLRRRTLQDIDSDPNFRRDLGNSINSTINTAIKQNTTERFINGNAVKCEPCMSEGSGTDNQFVEEVLFLYEPVQASKADTEDRRDGSQRNATGAEP